MMLLRRPSARLLGPATRRLVARRRRWTVRRHRKDRGIVATFKQVDTCAAEFEAYTPYYYSTYETEDETPGKLPVELRG